VARLEQGWRELVEMLQGQGRHLRTQVMTAEKFMLVDGRGEPRVRLECRDDGSTALVWLDQDGKYRAWLGLREDGSGYLTLKDRFGRICWETPREPSRSAAAAHPAPGGEPAGPSPESPMLERLEKLGADLAGLRELVLRNQGGPEDRREEPQAVAPAASPGEVGAEGGQETSRRLEHLERQQRGLKAWGAVLAVLLLGALAGLGFTLSRSAPPGEVTARVLTIHDPGAGACRAWLGPRDGGLCLDLLDREGKVRTTLGLDREGDPSLKLYDRSYKLRAELALTTQGDPGLSLADQAGLLRVALGSIPPGYQEAAANLERPLSSLVLFNQDGVPMWRAPLYWRR
jgi:hypothetical protein